MSANIAVAIDYTFDDSAKVWIRNDRKDFKYSDGDNVEMAIGNMLRSVNDSSEFSDQLKSLQINWPTVYYFSANRANILRPMRDSIAGARVLELGCGMGAITRFLGENAGEVIAVEGSLRRGGVAALRCKDLKNVHVVIDEIKSLPASLGKFDVVTLIGVLEYACRYGGPGAEKAVLKIARSFLKPGGFLVLAIENKLGLKYLGGVPEDHLQRSWVGVTNGYAANGVRTWSRRELLELLREAGFASCEQFVALPDYKLPQTLITPHGLRAGASRLDLAPFLNNSTRLFEPAPLFNAGEAWESVYKAGLLPDLADSLCFVAGGEKDLKSPFNPEDLVLHYGDFSSLPQKFAKVVKIVERDGEIQVTRQKLVTSPAREADKFYQVLNDEPYYSGELLFSRIRKIAMRPDWTLEEFFSALTPWVNILKENADADFLCDGALMDLTPFNIIMDENNAPRPFDLEWASRERLPLTYILYRGLYHTITKIQGLCKSSRHQTDTFSALFKAFVNSLHLPASLPTSGDYLWWRENKFMQFIKNNKNYTMPKDLKIPYMPDPYGRKQPRPQPGDA